MQTRTATASLPLGIVVAEARPRVRASLSETIDRQSDMRVVGSCLTIADTWRSLRECMPEVLLLDWRLPDDGALPLLRRLRRGPKLKVILLTEETSPDLLVEAMLLGARGAISRTARPDALIRCARAVMAGELWFSRRVTRTLRDRIVSRGISTPPLPVLEDILTPRESDVVRAVVRGGINRKIALELSISPQTVRQHLKSVFEKLHVSSRLELALLVTRNRV